MYASFVDRFINVCVFVCVCACANFRNTTECQIEEKNIELPNCQQSPLMSKHVYILLSVNWFNLKNCPSLLFDTKDYAIRLQTMANILISDAEKTFILHGVEDDLRCDGRTRCDYRPMEIETGIVTHANGSCRLRLANTDVLVAVKSEIDIPPLENPDEGKIVFFVDCSANATPEFEGRGGEELALEFSNTLESAYQSRQAFNLRNLCILSEQRCWKLYVDVLILECGGNLYDAVSLAVKGALFNTRLPKVTAALMDGGNVDLTLSEDPYDCVRLECDSIPILVTICKIGEHCVVDPSADEEVCSSASLVVGVCVRNQSTYITNIRTSGAGSFHTETFNKCLELGKSAGQCLDAVLLRILREEEKKTGNQPIGRKKIYGFLE